MSFARVRALRSLQTAIRPRIAAQTSRTQLVAKRFASSGSHGAHQASSDIPWAIGAVVITIPSVYFLWPDTTHAESGHHGSHGAEHKEEHAEEEAPEEEAPEEKEEEKEEAAPAADESKSEDESEKKGDDKEENEESEDKSEEKSEDKEEKSEEASSDDDKSEEKSEDGDKADGEEKKNATGKGKVTADSDANKESRKTEDDSKGATKKRVDSGLGKNLGEGSASEAEDGKQAGLSNTDTRHSVKIDEPGSEKSTKSEGGPDTAKVKGAVDPNRPAK